jgi:hypothetical protein
MEMIQKPRCIILFLIIFFIFTFGFKLKAQMPNCYCIPKLDTEYGLGIKNYENKDSVAIDSCYHNEMNLTCNGIILAASPTLELQKSHKILAKRWWSVWFDLDDVILLPKYPKDTIIDITFDAISEKYPDIKLKFFELEQNFGTFKLRKNFPQYDSGPESQSFKIYFYTYVNAGDIEDSIRNISHTSCDFNSYFDYAVDVKNGIFGKNSFNISPNPASDYININTNQLDEQVSSIEIYNILGEQVNGIPKQVFGNENTPEGEAKLDVSGLAPGMYYIALRTKKEVHYERFVVAR